MQVQHAKSIAQTIYRLMASGKTHKLYLDYLERHIDGIAGGVIKDSWAIQDEKHEFYYRNWLETPQDRVIKIPWQIRRP